MFENGPYSGEITLGDDIHGYEYYWIDGLNPRQFALNATFHVFKGNVFMLSDLHTRFECSLEKIFGEDCFTLFVFGRNFHIDQTMGVELPARYYEDFEARLRVGF
jgi:hypothetical protein